ncbi:MAG: class I SAM-dependent methyltransferase [Acidobacteriota bacterium]
MGQFIDFISRPHTSTKRDYLERVVRGDKAECATISKRFGFDYFDGDRRYGYGGYRYDGRWLPVAKAMAEHYGLKPGARILDIGCGKGFLLHDFLQVVPGAQVRGIDVSDYAIEHAMDDVKPFLTAGSCTSLPYRDGEFDLVVAINTLHNLYVYDLVKALKELQRVRRGPAYLVVDSYRNEQEKANLLHWQLTCECFFTPDEWEWLFQLGGYTGDYAFVTFE